MAIPTPTVGSEDSSLPLPPAPRAVAPMSPRLKCGLVAATAAGCAYVGLLDPNAHTIMPPCPFRSLTGLDCPGCGMTRAVHSLLHGDLVGALDHNAMLVVFMVVGVVWFATRRIRTWMGHPPKPFRISRPMTIALVVVTCAFWFARNLPFQPFHWLNATRS